MCYRTDYRGLSDMGATRVKAWASRLLGVFLATIAVVGCQALLATAASAETEGQAIVAAAQAIQSQSYPQQPFASAKYLYCFDGGTTTGASPGGTDPHPEGSYSNCNAKGRTGFDCRGLALYSVYQGTGGAVSLPTATAQAQYSDASSYGGSYISLSAVQPGDLVFFGSSSGAVDHVGIVVSGTGTSADIISAINEEDGITTETVHWFEAGFSWMGAVAVPGVGNTVGGGGFSEGEFIRTPDDSIYRVAGGAPLHITTCAPFGSDCTDAMNVSSLSGLSQYPANGTFINTPDDEGHVFVIAGGAPLYVASCSGEPPGCSSPIGVNDGTVALLAPQGSSFNGEQDLREVPLNSTTLRAADAPGTPTYKVAGGAPLYLASCQPGCGSPVEVNGYTIANLGAAPSEVAHLNDKPTDNTTIKASDSPNQPVYKFAGGAPLYLASCLPGCGAPVEVNGYTIDNLGAAPGEAQHMNAVPANSTTLRATDETNEPVYKVAGGAALHLTSCAPGCESPVNVNGYTIGQLGAEPGGEPHLNAAPSNGTVVEGLPSAQYWTFSESRRRRTAETSGAVVVNDESLEPFARPEPVALVGEASPVSPVSETLGGEVNPEGEPVSECRVEYGTTTAYGTTLPCAGSVGEGETAVPVSATAAGLKPGTEYHYHVVAVGPGGTSESNDATFTTAAFGITTESLPEGSVYTKANKAGYAATLTATGGKPPYKWSLTTGSKLPPGLKLSSKGKITGKATTAGTYTFTVQAVDTKTKTKPPTQNKATATLSITIDPA